MKGRQILVEPRAGGGGAAALMVDGVLEDLLIDPDPADPTPRPEALHRAVVGRPMKGMGGAFVELGDGAKGFLRGRVPPAGATVLVQISAWAEPGKAPPVAERIRLKGRLAILTPGAPGLNLSRSIPEGPERAALVKAAAAAMAGAVDGVGLIVRSLAARAEPDALAAEILDLRAAWERADAAGASGPPALIAPAPDAGALARRDWTIRPEEPVVEDPEALARAGVWETAAALLRPSAALTAGALVIEPTRALVAVDVNAGEGGPAAALQANLAAARALPRQLRLRGLGGQIVIDFAPLARTERPGVESALRAALRRDAIETTLAGWTPLGHLELLRKRARRPLAELPLR